MVLPPSITTITSILLIMSSIIDISSGGKKDRERNRERQRNRDRDREKGDQGTQGNQGKDNQENDGLQWGHEKRKEKKLDISMAEFVESILSRPNYKKNVRPSIDSGKPVNVTLNIFVNSISSIDDFNMEYSMTFYLRQSWVDERFAYTEIDKPVTLNYNDLNRIWIPDLFFRNEKKGMLHDMTVPNRLLRLEPDGRILFSQRVSLKLDCYMQLHKFPMDDQFCRMEIGSYGYTIDDLNFIWKEKDPLTIKEHLELPEFGIAGKKVGGCVKAFSTGAFACVFAEFHFDRKFEYYLLQTYFPSMLVVMLSWVSFWIDPAAVPARISLGLLTVLTMTTQTSVLNSRLPRVSYIKGIDVWMAACLLFVFGALIEYSAVNVMYRKDKIAQDKLEAAQKRREMQQMRNNVDHHGDCGDYSDTEKMFMEHTNDENEARIRHLPGKNTEVLFQGKIEPMNRRRPKRTFWASCLHKAKNNRAILIDVSSRVLFPLTFLAFSVIYWIMYALLL